jgi:hypothetical protein
MRVVCATTAGVGHVGPLEPFASACLRSGHDVLVGTEVPSPARPCLPVDDTVGVHSSLVRRQVA